MSNAHLDNDNDKKALLTQNGDETASDDDTDTVVTPEKDVRPSGHNDSDHPSVDPRFNPPTPSPFKRLALLVFVLLLFWFAFTLRASLWKGNREAKVIYANRYSKEHRFRPAASPIITETLKDGSVRIRGAAPTATPEPMPPPVQKTKARKQKKKKNRKPSRKTG